MIDGRPAAVRAHDLRKAYGGIAAVDGVDFTVATAECFGFLGPNGAGKTTTMKMIYGLASVGSGTLEVLGLDVAHKRREVKARLGVVPQEDNLDRDLTVGENLLVHAGYHGLRGREARARRDELLAFSNLGHRATADVRELSGGMRQRLLIARALVNRPDVVVLDEPTTGLDPQARRGVWDVLAGLREEGVTLLLTTHYMEEAARLCDRLVIMDRGKVVDEGAPAELTARHRQPDLEGVFLHLTGHGLEAPPGVPHNEDLSPRRQSAGDPDGVVLPRLSDALKVWRRNARVFSHIWKGALLPLFLDPLFYLVSLGFGLGTYLASVNGIPYKDFIAPGLCASAVMWAASFETTWNTFFKLAQSRQYDAIVTTPVEPEDLVLGELLWAATRAFVYGTVFLIVVVALGLTSSPWVIAMPPFLFLGGACFAACGPAYTSVIPKQDYFTFYYTLFVTPMFVFGGIFYPYDRLPDWAQTAAWLTPLYHLVNIARDLATGPDALAVLGNAAWLLVVTVVLFFAVPARAMRRRLVA